METLVLYHYFEAKNGPFRNLSSLPIPEAHEVLKRIKQDGTVFASRRSEDYLVIRRELEAKARQLFVGKGGQPVLEYPHYMTLGECKWLREWYLDAKELQLPLASFDPRTISFTYGDLFPTMRWKDGRPYREQVYRLDEIIPLIQQFGWPQEWNAEGAKAPERYIEVQVWDEAPLKKYLQVT